MYRHPLAHTCTDTYAMCRVCKCLYITVRRPKLPRNKQTKDPKSQNNTIFMKKISQASDQNILRYAYLGLHKTFFVIFLMKFSEILTAKEYISIFRITISHDHLELQIEN
jgi:hypothetical protein